MTLLLLLVASALLFAAHVARARRAALLFPKGYLKQRINLLLGLAIGYGVNGLVPWRLGELVRIWFVSRREGIRFAYSAAVVAAERLSDVVVLVTLSAAISLLWDGTPLSPGTALILFGALIVAGAGAWLVGNSPRARRLIWQGASLFNDRIRLGIADFVWSISEILRDGLLTRTRFLVATLIMWALYFAAYITFAFAIGRSAVAGINLLVTTPFVLTRLTRLDASWMDGKLLLFLALPIVAVLAWGMLQEGNFLVRLLAKRSRFGRSPLQERATSHERFHGEQEYRNFLTSLFGGEDRTLAGFALQALDDGVVHKLLPGGSDAITALVDVNGQLAIRKFASGGAAAKLQTQYRWLSDCDRSRLPLVDILREREGNGFFLYDMPLVIPANDFYDVIHTSPIARSAALLDELCGEIADFHERGAAAPASDDIVARYAADKIVANASTILDFARSVLPADGYSINGEAYALDEWDVLLDGPWTIAQMPSRATASIHGDLTIENVIIAPDTPRGWYIIDPNPGNLFDTPLIDWAKLMQSLNLGYEGINRSYRCSLSAGAILLSQTKSEGYSQLHARYEAFLVARFGEAVLREVYFHELVNYLRLTPYKIRQDIEKGLFFFGCTSLLLRRYRSRFG